MGCSDCQNKVLATVRGDNTWIFLVRKTSHLTYRAHWRQLRRAHAATSTSQSPLFLAAASRPLQRTYARVCACTGPPRAHSRRSIRRRTQVFMAVRAMRMQQLHRSPSVGPGRKRASASAHERGRSTGAARAHKLALCQLVPRLTHCGAPPYPSCCCSSPCCLCRQREARWPLIGARR